MSGTATNGHAPGPHERLARVLEELRVARAERELQSLRAERFSSHILSAALAEGAYDGYTGGAWGDLVDPTDAFRDADFRAGGFPLVDRGYARRDGWNRPFVWSDIDLDLQRSTARWVCTRNRIGVGVLATLTNYTVRSGFKWDAQPHPRYKTDRTAAAIAEQVTEFLRDFHRINAWSVRERSIFRRSRRDGEAFLRHFPQPDGMTLVRPVEPEQVYQPLGSPIEWSWGIHTDRDDIERVLAYAVRYHSPDDWEEVSAKGDELIHLKLNVDECVKRGLSDFYATGEALEGTTKLLRNMLVSGGVQAAIAWIEQFSAASGPTVSTLVSQRRDQNRPQQANPLTGQVPNFTKYEPGSIPRVGAGREYVAAPQAVGASVHIQIAQAAMRSIGRRWDMPEYMVSGDSSNANYASTLVSGSPFVTAVECEQDVYRQFFLRSQWYAARHAANSGRFAVDGRRFSAAEVEQLVEVHGTPPQVAIANKQEDAAIDRQDLEDGVTSPQEVAKKRGYDYEKVQQDRKAVQVQTSAGADDQPKGNTVGGLNAVAGLQADVYAGKLPRAAAVANVRVLLGLDQQAAEQLFPDVPPVKTTPDAPAGGPGPRQGPAPPAPPAAPVAEGLRPTGGSEGAGPFFPARTS